MPTIDSLVFRSEQIVARVLVAPMETIVPGDLLPHFEGKRYRALGTMSLIPGKDGEWRFWPAWGPRGGDARLVEVVVVVHDPSPQYQSYAEKRGRRGESPLTGPNSHAAGAPRKVRGGRKKAPSR